MIRDDQRDDVCKFPTKRETWLNREELNLEDDETMTLMRVGLSIIYCWKLYQIFLHIEIDGLMLLFIRYGESMVGGAYIKYLVFAVIYDKGIYFELNTVWYIEIVEV